MFSFLYVIWTRDESNKSSSFSICSFLDLEFRPSQQPSLIFCIFFNEFLTERVDVVKNKTKYKTNVLNIMRFVHSSSYLISRRLRPALCDSQNDTAFRFRLATENSLWREYILEKYFLRVSDKTPLCLCVTWHEFRQIIQVLSQTHIAFRCMQLQLVRSYLSSELRFQAKNFRKRCKFVTVNKPGDEFSIVKKEANKEIEKLINRII